MITLVLIFLGITIVSRANFAQNGCGTLRNSTINYQVSLGKLKGNGERNCICLPQIIVDGFVWINTSEI
jgi:hypothetical protein